MRQLRPRRPRTVALALLFLLLPVFPRTLRAHTPSATFLTLSLTGTNLTGQWDVALSDLQQGLGFDPLAIRALSVEELERRQEGLALDTVSRLELKTGGALLPLNATDYLNVTLNEGEYARVRFAAASLPAVPAVLELNARVLFTIDPHMHGLLRLEHDGKTETAVFNHEHPAHQFSLVSPANKWRQGWTFVGEGVWHIWLGFDHILFLLSLLLPAVLRREGDRWVGVEQFPPAFLQVLKIVTAFTLAHSLTLSLAALSVIQVPARIVESVIAASVALAALNNLWPWFRGKGWLVAFGFGLVHGFGFANVLTELGLARQTLALALVGFNVGVELGQLAIVSVFLPLAFGLRRSWFYQTVTFKFGSAAVVLIATGWMVERMFALRLMPF